VEDTSLFDASFAAFNEGDIERLFDLYTGDCVWDVTRFHEGIAADLADVYSGHEGLARFVENFAALIEPWGGARAEFFRALELDDGRFWVEGQMRYGSPGGAKELIEPFVQLLELREGKIFHVVVYWEPEEALRAASLEEVPAT
jgi:ketosteroid isomerase-like protein